ncbi:CNH-domain-containing protein [Phanerochaete sordida]|uniref:CNH-domain-containing protein n=1 Tax=Phanerochaete sordida TaxID=48140 RepID=A0A9P3LFU1_9APHY|nr:CNH-domain-containing protein [Phanerochaete sordida]
MDRPMGPRSQPERRNVAYESIFGRPSASHHHATPPPVPYGQQTYPYASTNGQYGAQLDRRTSAASSIAPSMNRSTQVSPNMHRQSYYVHQPPPHQHQPYPPPPAPSTHAYPGSGNLNAPSVNGSRARSVGRSPGIIVPAPEEPPDPSLEALTQAGLTPAQAYQAQIYMKSPMGHSQSKLESHHAQRNSAPNGLPQLALDLQPDNGKLDIDFPGDVAANENWQWEHSTYQQQTRSQPESVRSRMSIASSFAPIPEQPVASSSSRPYPLQLDTAVHASHGYGPSTSPASSTLVDPSPSVYQSTPPTSSSGRRSSESSRTLPGPHSRRDRTAQDRARSMSAALGPQVRAMLDNGRAPRPPLPSMPPAVRESMSSNKAHHRRTPIVYPALLSKVAQAFKERITLSDRVKDGLTYKDAFDGREAVDKIAYIIKTTDRNLALLLGRALDAQKFFHAVTYDHRLRDSSNDLYQFRTKMPSPFTSGDLADHEIESIRESLARVPVLLNGKDKDSPTQSAESGTEKGQRDSSPSPPDSVVAAPTTRPRQGSISSDDIPLPSGVFTLLTDCYSPTCSRDRLCYSIACPRRLEQQARLNMKPQPGLKKQISKESLGDPVVEPGTLWIHSVPQAIVDSVSDQEKKRQEAINEVIYTERDFVRDMEYLRDSWIKPLQELDIIPEPRRTDFLEQVFWNLHDIISVNLRLRDALNKRQKSYAIVEQIGDIFLDAVPHFGPFVDYGAHQLYGKYEFEKEKSSNPAFAAFVEEVERRPESRKLELNGYLTKPTTRLARYPLLLEAVLKHTPEDNPDKHTLPKVVQIVRDFLKAVNAETGKAENRFNLLQVDQQLVFRPGEEVDLRLQEEGRELVYKGSLKKRGGSQGDSAELMVFLFDHALLMVKQKSKTEQYKVYRRPIPLELLLVSAPDEFPTNHKSKQKALLKNVPYAPVIPVKEVKGGFSITFVHLGRKYYQITLWASTYVSQRKWVENIQKQQDLMRERSLVFETETLSEGFFVGVNRVNCAAPYSQGNRVVYGTNDGVYLWEPYRDPVKVLALLNVTQVDVLEDYDLLIVLSEGQVITFPLDSLDPRDPNAALKRAKRIASHASFFKAGVSLGRTLVCVVKTSALSSTIKVLEPIDTNVRGARKPTFKKLLQGGNDTLKLFKEFYIPVQSSSIHFLKTRLCVGCTNGFEIVDLVTLDTQGLIDPSDQSLEFVRKREGLRPIAIYRIKNEFLLCYDEFAFYVNKAGCRTNTDFMIFWEGCPTGFALQYPYVLAFEPTFVEIRDVRTGSMSQIIQGNNLRCLFSDTPPSTTNSESMLQNQYQQGYAQGAYGSPQASYYGQPALQNGNGYGSPYPQGYPQAARGPSTGRDEILMVSDDRVMRLRMRPPQ